MIKVGKNIKKLREKKSITQEKLANYLGVTPQAISRWESETGYPDIELLPMIANFFDVTIDELLDRNILQNKNEIKEGIKEIDRLHTLGETKRRKELIIELYNKYPYNFELMNYFKTADGFMYHAVQPILEYEVGLTVNEIDAGSSMTDEEKKYTQMVDAIYQFRSWEYDEKKDEPVITDFTGLDYQATFEANSPSNSRAYWIVNENGWNEEVAEIKTGRTYQKISAPEEPICEGYKFLGWAETKTAINPTYTNGYTQNIKDSGSLTLYAIWHTNTH